MRSILFSACLSVLILPAVFMALSGEVGGAVETDEEVHIAENDFFWIRTRTEIDDWIEVSVTVRNTGDIDVYILREQEFYRYRDDEEFIAELAEEQAWDTWDNFLVDDNEVYFVVVDNRDNVHNDDAVPDGDVYCDIYIAVDESWDYDEPDPFYFVMCCGIAVVIVMVGIVVCIRVVKSTKKPSGNYPRHPFHQPPVTLPYQPAGLPPVMYYPQHGPQQNPSQYPQGQPHQNYQQQQPPF